MIFFGGNNSSPPVQNKVIVFVSHKTITYARSSEMTEGERSPRAFHETRTQIIIWDEKNTKLFTRTFAAKSLFFFRW